MIRTKYVDTIIGTVGDEKTRSFHGGGKVHPGACVPGGMVQLSPDTVTGGDNGTGYNYCQNTIEGFSFNHMSGIGWYGDLGNLQIMPITGQTDLRSGSNAEVPFINWKHRNSILSKILLGTVGKEITDEKEICYDRSDIDIGHGINRMQKGSVCRYDNGGAHYHNGGRH